MYSNGFPVLYIVGLLFHIVIYWVYKYLLINYYSISSMNNEILAIKSIGYIKYGIIFHMIIGGFMFTKLNHLVMIY